MPLFLRRAIVLVGVVVFLLGQRSLAQTTYTWNYSGTDWNSASSWSPTGVPTSVDTAILGTFDTATLNAPSFSADAAAGQFRLIGPGFVQATVLGGGHTLTVGTGGLMTAAPFTYRGTFGSTIIFDNLQVNIATGTAFQSGNFEQTVGAMELTGLASRLDLRNGSQLRLVDAAGTTNYDLSINGGQVTVRAGAQITNGVGVNSGLRA